ncbi:MAG: hypothetical protein K6G04_09715, partial [Lachnospiraceae bacterium]|nr:hypothetical protein [Lachnospiraceae bacterium]
VFLVPVRLRIYGACPYNAFTIPRSCMSAAGQRCFSMIHTMWATRFCSGSTRQEKYTKHEVWMRGRKIIESILGFCFPRHPWRVNPASFTPMLLFF